MVLVYPACYYSLFVWGIWISENGRVKIVMVSAEVTLNEEAEDLFLLKELDIEVFRLQKNLAEALKLNNLMDGNGFCES